MHSRPANGAADDRKNEAINAERSGAFYADASASFFDGLSPRTPKNKTAAAYNYDCCN
jgi:hypothetical protein